MKQKKDSGVVFKSLKAYLGEDVAELIKELSKKKDYSEFKLADALGKEVNGTRNLLYKLYNSNLASFIKKKDNKVGWYIHYWTFHQEGVIAFLLNEKKGRLELLRELAEKESKSAPFSCANACVDVDFDKAFDFSFRCPECGELLNQEDNLGKVKGWEGEVTKLEKEIRLLEKQNVLEREGRLAENTKQEEKKEGEKRGRE